MTQYMEGRVKVLREMIREDGASTDTISNYVNYQIKIATFAQTFKWDSVLRYALEYRKGQSEVGFEWGCDSPYLMQLHLQANAFSNMDQHKQRSKSPQSSVKNKYDPTICRRFNSQSGCDLKSCKFAHICMSCYASHSDCSTVKESKPAT